MSKRLFDDEAALAAKSKANREAWGDVGRKLVELSVPEFQKMVGITPKAERRKHGNVPTVVDGIRFDSKHEAQVWQDLKLREKAGEIRCLQRQVSFPLTVGASKLQRWKADFWFYELQSAPAAPWKLVIADAKSPHTASLPAWKRTRALFEELYGVTVTIL